MRLFYTLGCLLLAANLLAVPARRFTFQARMTDGTLENITFCGDEYQSFYLSEDGYVVEKSVRGDGYIKTGKRPADLLSDMRSVQLRSGIGSPEDAPIKSVGSPKIPVILVNFSDTKMTVADADADLRDYYDKYCNGTRDGVLYTGAGSKGAVRDYFVQQSDSLFLPEFEIVGPVTLSRPLAYYGENSGGKTDVNFSDFCEEALQLAMELRPDFEGTFDNDGNGTVDLAFFIYAGLSEAECRGGRPETIWPKEWLRPTVVNGVTVSVMACTSELSVTSATVDEDGTVTINKIEPAGIGTMCHEVAHSLGLPDEYDTRNGVALGMSYWSLMDSGNYCDNGKTPCGLTAYERDFLGWRPLEVLGTSTTVRLRPLEAGGGACKVVNPEHADEYYVLENRQTVGWDSGLCKLGHGMLVVHVDYNAASWASNILNVDPDHQRMSFIPANNIYVGPSNATSQVELLNALGGQPYPGITGNVALTDETVPAATVFQGGLMGRPVTQIRELDNGDIVFKFMAKGQLAAPGNLKADKLTSAGFRLSWDGSANASCYAVQVYGIDAEDKMSEVPVFAVDSVYSETCEVTLGKDASYTSYACSVSALHDEYEDSPWSDSYVVRWSADGIRSAETDREDGEVKIYSLHGILVGDSRADLKTLPSGIYIIGIDGRRSKIVVGK